MSESIYAGAGLTAIALGVAVLVLLIGYRPSLTDARGGKVLAFLCFFALPLLVTLVGASQHIQHSKSTSFCLSCHVMEPYGKSLRVDDPAYVPAVHYQNHLIPREEACYTCHTTYTMFGDFRSKLTGLKHVYVYYLGTVPETIELYRPFENRECLHCHAGARSFEQREEHVDIRADLGSNGISCLDCHADIHDVENLEGKALWTEPSAGASR